MNVDVHNDGYLDFQYHYVYDDWNRLRDIYAGYLNDTTDNSRIVHYDYDDAFLDGALVTDEREGHCEIYYYLT